MEIQTYNFKIISYYYRLLVLKLLILITLFEKEDTGYKKEVYSV